MLGKGTAVQNAQTAYGDISRRNFVRTAGAVTAAALGGAAVGVASAEEATGGDWLPAAWDYECDVLVIGYGGAGMFASLIAADEGDAEVLVLEKAPTRGGGNSFINLGEFTYTEDPETAAEYVLSFSTNITPKEVALAWAEECTRNIEYLQDYGLEPFIKGGTEATGGVNSCEFPLLPGSEALQLAGMAPLGAIEAFETLDELRQDLGVEVVFSCHDETLIQDPQTKEILGCWTYIGDDPEPKAVKARRGTVITTGGFEFNEEMKNEYLKVTPCVFYGWPFNTGDGHRMVQEVGGQLWHMNSMLGEPVAYFPKDEVYTAGYCAMKPTTNNFIWTNRFGKRWRDESAEISHHNGWYETTHFDFKAADFDRIPTWQIIDSTCFNAGPLYGGKGEGVLGFQMGMNAADVPSECGAMPGWSADNSEELARGIIPWGNTVEELAEMMHEIDDRLGGMDVDALKKTIEDYNAYCEAGEDPEFGRNPETLLPLVPPFYAIPYYPAGVTTLGGAKKNTKAQVLDIHDEVIPRLYAAGSFGNMAAHCYGLSGGCNGENMVWGRIAGRNASAEEPWDER